MARELIVQVPSWVATKVVVPDNPTSYQCGECFGWEVP